MQTYRRHLNAAASRDFITPGNLITIPRLLRMDDHATLAHIETKLLHVYHVLNSSILASKSA